MISPGDVFATGTGTLMIPYPMNQDVPVSEFEYYTFRDTSVYARGAPNGFGVEIVQNYAILGLDPMTYIPVMAADDVSTIGLPLLMQFECFPDNESVGGNTFDISRAGVVSTRPAFRAFSEGGVDQSGNTILRDPDLEREANGGFNPLSNPPGEPTEALDDLVYMGSLDLVTRVSRSYSIWFQTTGTTNPLFNPPTLDPLPEDQPIGSELQVSFRGASNITGNADVLQNADTLDLYGDHYTTPDLNRASGSAQRRDHLHGRGCLARRPVRDRRLVLLPDAPDLDLQHGVRRHARAVRHRYDLDRGLIRFGSGGRTLRAGIGSRPGVGSSGAHPRSHSDSGAVRLARGRQGVRTAGARGMGSLDPPRPEGSSAG